MPMEQDAIDELTAMIAVARKRELNFGVCLGKKPEGAAFQLHRKKSAEILGRQAKKAGETAKTAFGIMEVKGKVITLTCENDPPPGAAKSLRMFFRSINVPMKVQIADSEGNMLDADGDDEDDGEAANQSSEAQADPSDDAKRWAAAEPAIANKVATAMKADGPSRKKIEGIWNFATGKAANGDHSGAVAALKQLMPLLKEDATVSASPSGPDPYSKAIKDLYGDLKAYLAADPARGADVKPLVALASDKSADADARQGAIDALRALLGPENEDSTKRPMVIWRDAKESTDASMSALQRMLSDASDPNLKRIAEFGLNGVTAGNQVAMTRALMDFDNASGAARISQGETLLKQTGAYRQFLSESPAIALCENNPFGVTCAIKLPLTKALDQIENTVRKAIAA